ncbi:hypothetical protein KSB_16860 [Ktedonobacter robiniae]|uniref:Uncharacterized protein n=1 Tax=Ktedonobacter robiniae TaxID=2778365 RepID=A0ABQ3UKE5_9CHLR|nr:hypothetical protein KSB_16860 [Ktedonobacter robiniae]
MLAALGLPARSTLFTLEEMCQDCFSALSLLEVICYSNALSIAANTLIVSIVFHSKALHRLEGV